MRKAALAMLAVVLCGAVALLIVGASTSRTLAFTLGVGSFAPVVELRPGDEVCQRPIPVGADFDEVQPHLGTYGRAGQPLSLEVRDAADDELLGRGELPGGYGDNARPRIAVGEVDTDGEIAVCIVNEGSRRVALYGGADLAARTSSADLDGRPVGFDVDLVFRTAEPRSTLALLPEMLSRASLFRGGWIGTWWYWLLFAAVAVAAPALLWRALASAGAQEREPDHDG